MQCSLANTIWRIWPYIVFVFVFVFGLTLYLYLSSHCICIWPHIVFVFVFIFGLTLYLYLAYLASHCICICIWPHIVFVFVFGIFGLTLYAAGLKFEATIGVERK